MQRREFLSFAAAGAAITTPQMALARPPDLETALEHLQLSIKAHMPGISRVEICCRPEDPRMPLMIFAYRD